MYMSQQRQKKVSVRDLSEQEVVNYFFPRPIPVWTSIAIITGVVLLIIGGILQNIFVMAAGLVVGFISGYIIYKTVRSNPNDAQYDAWVERQGKALYSRGLQMLGIQLHNRDTVQCIRSYVLPGSLAAQDYIADDVLMKRGKDGRLRFSINVYTYIFATTQWVAVFKSDVNAFTPLIHNDMHEIYAYRHIVGATTSQLRDEVIFEERRFPYRTEQFCLKIANGETVRLSAAVKAGPLSSAPGVPAIRLPNTGFDRTLNELRQILLAR